MTKGNRDAPGKQIYFIPRETVNSAELDSYWEVNITRNSVPKYTSKTL